MAYAPMAMPSKTACGSPSRAEQSMNAPGVAFVAVADEVLDAVRRFGVMRKPPLLPGGEARTAATAQPGGHDLLDHLVGRHAREHLVEGLIAARFEVVVDVLRIDDAHVPQGELLLGVVERVVLGGAVLRSARATSRSISPPRMCFVDDLRVTIAGVT